MQSDERALIDRSIAKDADAYGKLVDRYKDALYRHSFAILRNTDDAQDVAQDTFITAYYRLESFDTSKRFSTWLFKISTNKALNRIRSDKHTTPLDDTFAATLVSPHSSPQTAAENLELHSAIAKLKPEYRAVIHLYYFEGLGYAEIADVLAKPQGSIKGWMSRAKQDLRKELS